MTRVAASALGALVSYYRRLAQDPSQSIPEFGFSMEKICFQVVLEADGSLADFQDIRDTNQRGRKVPKRMEVPDGGGRSGTGVKPFFCWDNTGYALGADDKGQAARNKRKFAAFRDQHLALREEAGNDDGFRALCAFLARWDPGRAATLPGWEDAAGTNVVFRLRGREGFVHQSDRVRQAWLRHRSRLSGEDTLRGVSLMSGEEEDLKRLHPLVAGVVNAQPSGAAIVSFNADAYRSYGKTQSYNAPVGVGDAFRYTAALNHLLADSAHRVRIGDATVVFWTDRPEGTVAEEVLRAFFSETPSTSHAAESGTLVERLHDFLRAARQGRLLDRIGQPEAAFYVLGLSPNASRINVRFWLADSVGEFTKRLERHIKDLDIAPATSDDPPPSIVGILDETVPTKNGRPDRDRVSPLLSGELTRAVLLGLPYPTSLLSGVVGRIRAEGFAQRDRRGRNYRRDHDWKAIMRRRAGILRAFLIRNKHKEVSVSLNKDHPDQAYHLGRLFAALEKTQEDSSERELNSTIKDRYFGAASATPGAVFPLLLRLHQHHLTKVENVGHRVNREKLVGEICGHLKRFPTHLPIDEQGLFYVGYYHQRQDFFTKRTESTRGVVNA